MSGAVGGFVWWFLHFHYENKTEILKISYEWQIKNSDDLLNEYRQRLHIADTNKTAYSQLTHNELQMVTEKLTSKMSEYLQEKEQEDHQHSDANWNRIIKASSEEEKKKLWDIFVSELTKNALTITTIYNVKFRADATLLRDELLSRLPKEQKNGLMYNIYEHPVNIMAFWMVISDLQRLSKSLPK